MSRTMEKANPDRTVAQLRDVLACSGRLLERGMPVILIEEPGCGLVAKPVSPDLLLLIAHEVCRPFVLKRSEKGEIIEVDAPMPRSMAVAYMEWHGERRLRPLNGIASTPMLNEDGSISCKSGYDGKTGLWLTGVADVAALVPVLPSREDAIRALARIRGQFASFCFGDAVVTRVQDMPEPIVNLELPPGEDESAMLAALVTAICRPSLSLAPGILLRAAGMSGAGSGKGLLARCICLVAFGREPFAVTAGGKTESSRSESARN
jgi:hypothetical protein